MSFYFVLTCSIFNEIGFVVGGPFLTATSSNDEVNATPALLGGVPLNCTVPSLSIESLVARDFRSPLSTIRSAHDRASGHSAPAGQTTSNPLASNLGRNAILTYAYRLYQSQNSPAPSSELSAAPVFDTLPEMTSSEHVYATQLVPLLTTLRSLHPDHLPTLLLLGSVHYAMGDYSTSLSVNEEILSIDSEYVGSSTHMQQWDHLTKNLQVEAMCNMGAIMKKLGHPDHAYNWWWKALQLRPTYWDVTVRCSYICGKRSSSYFPRITF